MPPHCAPNPLPPHPMSKQKSHTREQTCPTVQTEGKGTRGPQSHSACGSPFFNAITQSVTWKEGGFLDRGDQRPHFPTVSGVRRQRGSLRFAERGQGQGVREELYRVRSQGEDQPQKSNTLHRLRSGAPPVTPLSLQRDEGQCRPRENPTASQSLNCSPACQSLCCRQGAPCCPPPCHALA
ncbi:hypothetical protein HJG60_010064 [Phyllostomus discolor]|uniref:Uncharacterized protein n=1 Tax=Phyllostomus discolor TaxID=89673 RepID=A0A834AVU6_9CHIR|nr:hypothetical protein HJG60_010064 [Phyllostomus discolor]